MTQLLVNIQKQTDLEMLLDVLKRMQISFTQTEDNIPVAEKIALNTEGYLSAETIKQLYPNEWILVASAKKDGINVVGGIVIAHHTSKREMALQGREVIKNYSNTAHFYTGEFPKMRHLGLFRKISV